VRIRTLADVVDGLGVNRKTIVDGMEIQGRRSAAAST